MRALDCCAGAGGLSLGLQRAGFDVHGVELDAVACETHRAMVGSCDQADLWEYAPRERYDLVAGGIPCQSNSNCGERLGSVENRGQLFDAVLRIAIESWARCVLVENVRGILAAPSPTHASVFEELSETFRKWYPYQAHAVLNAADFGVPQFRRRLFFVAFARPEGLERLRWPRSTHAEQPDLLTPRRWVTVRDVLDVAGNHPALDRPSPCVLATEQRANLRGKDNKPTRAGDVLCPAMGRRPTVAELATLQGFAPGFEFSGTKTQQHRQVGNAVPPPLAEAVGRSIRYALEPDEVTP